MDYKKRNIIGILSFITIILLMVNFNMILETVNYKLLGIKFVGIKGDELFLSDLNQKELSKEEFIMYINSNLNKIEKDKLEKFEFSIYMKDIETQENFSEVFRLPIDMSFTQSLYTNINLIPENKDLLVKFVLHLKDKNYTSKVFPIKLH